MLFRDPIPTPAARCGRVAIVAGLAGWCALIVAVALYLGSLAVADDVRLQATFRTAAGWMVGPAIVAFLVGTVAAAAGVTRQIHSVRDPGLSLIVAGFLVNGLPMVLVAGGAAYDKVAPKIVESRNQ